ncbi:MAG: endonuclease III [Candidatus Aenigmarchaeota archaeon]|nr:endonuclease III [Candidatus Aenigmarchaeota archaeon]
MNTLVSFLRKNYYKERLLVKDKFRLLITTVLSQRTRDENTDAAAKRLFSVAKTPKQTARLSKKRLEELIKSSGTYRQKAKHIKEISKIINEKYNSRVPQTREELLSLPGVGYKTADIVLSYGYGVPTIAVDTHVNRIPKRIGIVPEKTKLEEARLILEALTPKKDRFVVNLGLVRFGQEICRPIGPKCQVCELNRICNYGIRLLRSKNNQ